MQQNEVNKKNRPEYSHILLAGANDIIETFKSSGEFIDFFSVAINWLNNLNDAPCLYRVPDSAIYTLTYVIRVVGVPWTTGGPAFLDNVAKGLDDVLNHEGPDGWVELVGSLAMGMAYDMNDGGFIDSHMIVLLNQFACMQRIGERYKEINKLRDEWIKAS